jgi:hypothetical protein
MSSEESGERPQPAIPAGDSPGRRGGGLTMGVGGSFPESSDSKSNVVLSCDLSALTNSDSKWIIFRELTSEPVDNEII